MNIKVIKYFSVLIFSLVVFGFSGAAYSQCVVLNANNDGADSLRDCIENQGDLDVIVTMGIGPIQVTSEIIFSSNKTITGNGETVTANDGSRVFSTVDDGSGPFDIEINDLTITGGNGVGATNSSFGGAIHNSGHNLTINRSNITFSNANTGGGIAAIEGMTNAGSLTINESTIRNNTALSTGGIYLRELTGSINDSTISNNMSTMVAGGGITADRDSLLTVTNSTICDNETNGLGGGILVNDATGSTTANLIHVTIADNRADEDGANATDGGGIANQGTVNTTNILILGNTSGGMANNCNAAVTADIGANSSSDDASCAPIPDEDPSDVSPTLANNGGPTLTKSVFITSNIFEVVMANCLSDDQRGEPRAMGIGPCTPGAFEPQDAGSFQITKSVIGGGMQQFDFNMNAQIPANLLDSDCNPELTSGVATLGDTDDVFCGGLTVPETYVVQEVVPPGFQLVDINCVNTGTANPLVDINQNRVLIQLVNPGDRSDCTFTNNPTPTFDLMVDVTAVMGNDCDINSSPGGILNCSSAGGTCTASFTANSAVQLTNTMLGVDAAFSGDCNAMGQVTMSADRTCNVSCTEMMGDDDDDDDDDNNDDNNNDDNNDDNNNNDDDVVPPPNQNVAAINGVFTLFGPSQNGPFGDETTQQLVYTGFAGGTNSTNNLSNIVIEILEDDGLDIINMIIEPNVGSCQAVVQEAEISEAKEVLSFVCNVPFLAAGESFDMIMDVFIESRNNPDLENSRVIEFDINASQFTQELIAFVSVLVTDNGQGCTVAAAGSRNMGTLAVFALIPGLVLLRIFRRRFTSKD